MRVACPIEPGLRGPAQLAAVPDPRLQPLRDRIRAIECRSAEPLAGMPGERARLAAAAAGAECWTLGEPGIDELIGDRGLEAGAVHEIKPAHQACGHAPAASWAASCVGSYRFALALAVRRLMTGHGSRREAPVLLCIGSTHAAELGQPYGPGLAGVGLDPARLVVVEPARPSDALWAIEEALKSEGLALVLGHVDTIDLTPARRLALSAARTATPCLVVTHPRSPAVAATATRWRIGPAPSAPHALDPQAPGATRFEVALERCRGSPAAARSVPSILEWCDAAYRFRMASGVADTASGTRPAAGRPRAALG